MEHIKEEILILGNITNDDQFNTMTRSIESFYDKMTPFYLKIETQMVRKIKWNYLYKFGNYLNTLKQKSPQYLRGTTIHVYDDLNFNLLYTLFTYISSPIAKVSVFYFEGGYTPTNTSREIKKIKNYYPRE